MKRTISILLCLMLVLSLAAPVFADGGYTITINNTKDGHVYEAYQIFTGILSGEAASDEVDGTSAILSNVQWGASVTNASALDKAADVAEKLANGDMTVDELLDMVTLSATAYKTSTDKGDYYLIEGLDAGYYLVKDKDETLDGVEDDAYTDFILEVVEDSVVSPKSSWPSVDKNIVEGEDKVDVNEAGIGEVVKYEITGTLPSNIADYAEYFYKFTDTLSKGLTYNNDMKVTVGGVDVTTYFYKNVTEYDETDGTTITVAIQDLLALELLGSIDEITKDTKIVLTYSATVNKNAVVNGANENKVDLEYSNNPNDSDNGTPDTPSENPGEPTTEKPTGKTPESEVATYTTEIIINKVDGNRKPLNGAEFEIKSTTALKAVLVKTQVFTEDAAGDYWKLKDGTYTETAPVSDDPATDGVNEDNTEYYESTTTKYSMTVQETEETVSAEYAAKAFVDANGKLVFSDLPAGEYTITETTTPEGYNTIDPFSLKITFDAETKAFAYEWVGVAADAGNAASVTVVNQSGSTLPETGGVGTTLFYVFGSVMFIGAAVLLITKKRMAA